ncbi:MAG TPA: DMT family transporter [Patescibacteria group bacterium]|nr:DMT family transporter [Patescibacteria group bacterium]
MTTDARQDTAGKTMRAATVLALAAAVISGTNNFLTKIAVTAVRDPLVYTTLKNAIVAVILVAAVLAFRSRKEIAALRRPVLLKLLAVGAIGGSLPFALYFTGLARTSAINAAMIHKTLFIWVLLLAAPFLKERLTRLQWLGIAATFGANLVVGGFSGFRFDGGELMILAATVLWAVENVFAKKALQEVSSSLLAAARMGIGALILLPFALARGGAAAVAGLGAGQWGWTLLTSVLLLGYVVAWYAALKRAPATYVATLLVPATLVTNALTAAFVTHALPGRQLASAAMLAVGASLMIVAARRSSPARRPAAA